MKSVFCAEMGVKGLQTFMERCCPGACVPVNLREMAKQHADQSAKDCTTPATNNSWVHVCPSDAVFVFLNFYSGSR